jgi:hypothetical protein
MPPTIEGKIMNLGSLANYPMPAAIRDALGASTAQQLADRLGADGTFSPELAHAAESAYNALRAGDREPARALLVDAFSVEPATADAALEKLSGA